MGTVFQLPWSRLAAWPADLDALRAAGFVTAALTPDPGALDLTEFAAAAPPRLAWVLGTEGDGVRASTLAATDVRVHGSRPDGNRGRLAERGRRGRGGILRDGATTVL